MKIIETNLKFSSLTNRTNTNRIILHHAEASKCTPEQIHQWHLNNGWSGAGYHFLVRKDGKIYRLRPENAIGAHAQGSNSYSLGVCFEGNFMKETMGQAQIDAGHELVEYLKKKYNISTVLRHKDVGATNCPGVNFPFNAIVNGTSNKPVAQEPTTDVPKTKFPLAKGHWYGMPDKNEKCHSGYYDRVDRPAIKRIQKRVGVAADGYYGEKTRDAVIKFQKANKLTADGLVGIKTWKVLF